jgi:LysR family transcriptional activator of nhaA
VRAQFELVCEDVGIEPLIRAEVDDMATIRLLARSSDSIALVPAVVVRDEIRRGELEKYCEVPRVFENFYAVTMKRRFQPAVLRRLLAQSGVGTPEPDNTESTGDTSPEG